MNGVVISVGGTFVTVRDEPVAVVVSLSNHERSAGAGSILRQTSFDRLRMNGVVVSVGGTFVAVRGGPVAVRGELVEPQRTAGNCRSIRSAPCDGATGTQALPIRQTGIKISASCAACRHPASSSAALPPAPSAAICCRLQTPAPGQSARPAPDPAADQSSSHAALPAAV